MTDLRREINRRFGDAGITFAFPQMDVHLFPAAGSAGNAVGYGEGRSDPTP